MSEKKILNGYIVGGYACAFGFSLLVWGLVFFQASKLVFDHEPSHVERMADSSGDLRLQRAEIGVVKREIPMRSVQSAG